MKSIIKGARVRNAILFVLIFAIPIFILNISGSFKKKKNTSANLSSVLLSPYSKTTYTHLRLIKPDSFLKNQKYDSAIFYYKMAEQFFKEQKIWQGYVKSLIKTGISFKRKGCATCKDSAYNNLRNAEHASATFLDKENIELSSLHYYWGEFYKDPLPNIALQHYLINAEIINRYYKKKPSLLIANAYLLIGETYFYQLSDYNKADQYFKKVVAVTEEIKDSILDGNFELAKSYLLIVKSSRIKGDYYEGIKYGKMAIKLASTLPDSYVEFISDCDVVLGNILYENKNYTEAEQLYSKAIHSISQKSVSPSLINYYNNLAATQIELNRLEDAKENIKKSILLNIDKNPLELSNSFVHLSKVHRSQFDSSLFYLTKALKIRITIYSQHHEKVALIYNEMGLQYERIGNYNNALSFFQRALNSMMSDYKTDNAYINPPDSLLFNSRQLFDIFNSKANAFKEYYYSDTNNILYLKKSVENFLLAEKVMKMNRISYEKEESKLFLIENYKKNYEDLLDALFTLNKHSSKPDIFENVIQAMENSKYALLTESVNKHQLDSIIPSPVLQEEIELKGKIIDLNLQANKIRAGSGNTMERRKIDSLLFLAERSLQFFKNKYELQYPFYFNSKYKAPTVSLAEIQQNLPSQKKIIEFFWGEHASYIILIGSHDINFQKVLLSKELEKEIEEEIRLVSIFNADSIKEDLVRFKSVSNTIYNTFLKPLGLGTSNASSLIFIPDGPLNLLPFETLVTEPKGGKSVQYNNLSYLIKKYCVSYSYSIRLLLPHLKNKSERTIRDFVAFENLPSSDEFNALINHISKSSFSASQCTKDNFKQQLSLCDGIHLTTHGKGLQNDNYGSRLLFNSTAGKDDVLYAQELYSQNLNNIELFTLNACETGIGKFHKGEGVYSIARGITYAGGKSILLSLLKIPQKSTDKIMGRFYNTILSSADLDVALRESKLNYINQQQDGITAHPAFWSGVILSGNSKAIHFQKPWPAAKVVFIIAAFLLISTGIFKLYSNKRQL